MPALLALFIRSLREDTRSRAMLWTRIGLAGAVLFSVWQAHLASRLTGGAAGLQFFESVVWINFAFISIAGLSYFATPITEEKEEDTLGLLRMTDLSPFAILLGKSTSRFIGGALLLLVQLPFALLAVTLGGVRLEQVTGAYALLGAYMFFACNAGLLASVIARRAGGAAAWAGIFVFAWAIWPTPVIWALLNSIFEPTILSSFNSIGPYRIVSSLDSLLSTRGSIADIGRTLAWLLLGGAGAFAIARWKFDAFCDEGGESPTPAPAVGAPSATYPDQPAWLTVKTAPRRPWNASIIWRNDAVAWRDYHFIHGGTQVAWIKAGIYLLGAMVIAVIEGSSSSFFRSSTLIAFTIFFASLVILCCESAFAASRNFRIERKERTLSSLCILPFDVPDLMRSKRRAMLLSLAPVSVFLTLGTLLLVAQMTENMRDAGGATYLIAQGIACFIAQLYFNLRFIAWLSLRMKWGALPVALSLSWIANMIIIPLAFLMFREAFLFMLTSAAAVAAALMTSALRERIVQAAAEE